SCPLHHRALHSFPTRRSSDLFAVRGPKAARARRRAPGFIRRRAMPDLQSVGGREEAWTLGFLIDVILTRDPWMHRADIARATGRSEEHTSELQSLTNLVCRLL